MALIQHTDRGGRPRNKETILASRPGRKPLHSPRDILRVDGVPRGIHSRWVNDVDDRIVRFQQAGYEFITTKGVMVGERTVDLNPDTGEAIGSVVCRRVGTFKDGQPEMAYLMGIEEEFFEEDQRVKQDKITKTERSMMAPRTQEGQYGAVKYFRQ